MGITIYHMNKGSLLFEGGADKVRCCGQGCYEKEWEEPTCCFCCPVEKGLRVLMWSTLIGTVLNALNIPAWITLGIANVGVILSIVSWVINIFQCVLFVKFLKEDSWDTRAGVAKALFLGFITCILGSIAPCFTDPAGLAVLPFAIGMMIPGL